MVNDSGSVIESILSHEARTGACPVQSEFRLSYHVRLGTCPEAGAYSANRRGGGKGMRKLDFEVTIQEWVVRNIDGGIVNVGQSQLNRVSRPGVEIEVATAERYPLKGNAVRKSCDHA